MKQGYVLFFVSAWEAIALSTGWLPTVTAVVSQFPRPVRIGLAVAAGVWLVVHFDRA